MTKVVIKELPATGDYSKYSFTLGTLTVMFSYTMKWGDTEGAFLDRGVKKIKELCNA